MMKGLSLLGKMMDIRSLRRNVKLLRKGKPHHHRDTEKFVFLCAFSFMNLI